MIYEHSSVKYDLDLINKNNENESYINQIITMLLIALEIEDKGDKNM